MTSIRKKLLLYILSLLALSTVVISALTFYSLRHEMDELYDENMKQVAVIFAGTILKNGNTVNPEPFSNKKPHGEEEFLIQIWDQQKLEYSSHPAADFSLQSTPGFGHAIQDAHRWVYYTLSQNGKTIQISQDLHERHKVIREVYNAIIIPIAIQFPIVALLIWGLIGLGFRPLHSISTLIQHRTAIFMDPIPDSKAPDEIRSLVHALNDLLARLKQSLETQRRFTADAAHELRTPLTAVRLQLDLLQRATSDHDRNDAIQTLERGVERSIRLAHQLLELARQEPDNIVKTFAPVALANDVIAPLVQEYTPLALQKNITLDVIQNAAPVIQGDAASLSVMISNLLSNAIAYTPPGGRIVVELNAGGLNIADNGIGVPPEDHHRIFDRFYRVIGTGTTGSGLGLSIVQNIARLHNIKISLDQGLDNRGTTFRLNFSHP